MDTGVGTIMIVEDDDIDAAAILRSFSELQIGCPVVRAHDGAEALQLLRGTNGFERVSPPVLVLLDLSMPKMNGLEFLETLRADQLLHCTTVFVLATAATKQQRVSVYAYNIAGYIKKPASGQDFHDIASMIKSYCQTIIFA